MDLSNKPGWTGYSYEHERPKLFTEEGVKLLRAVEKSVDHLLSEAGAFREGRVSLTNYGVGAYDSWPMMACLDYLVEQGKLVRWERPSWAQFRVYTTPETENR